MSKLWTNTAGKVVLDATGKLISCPDCPCGSTPVTTCAPCFTDPNTGFAYTNLLVTPQLAVGTYPWPVGGFNGVSFPVSVGAGSSPTAGLIYQTVPDPTTPSDSNYFSGNYRYLGQTSIAKFCLDDFGNYTVTALVRSFLQLTLQCLPSPSPGPTVFYLGVTADFLSYEVSCDGGATWGLPGPSYPAAGFGDFGDDAGGGPPAGSFLDCYNPSNLPMMRNDRSAIFSMTDLTDTADLDSDGVPDWTVLSATVAFVVTHP